VGLGVAHRSTADGIGQVIASGDSVIASGDGVSDTTRDVMTRLAAMLGAKEFNYAKGGAVLMWGNDFTRSEYGILPSLLHWWKRPVRPASALSGNSIVGASVISVTPNPATGSTTGPAYVQGQLLHIGNGTNGELARVQSTSSTQITLAGFEGTENWTGLVRSHSTGDPVYVVPGHYGAGNTLFLFECVNQLGRYGSGGTWANAQRWFQEALRMALSRMRAAEEFNPDHTSIAFTGSWGAAISSPACSGSTIAQGARNPTLVNAAATWHVPNNFPGGTISFNILQAAGDTGGDVYSVTVDGSAWTVNGTNTGTANTVTTVATPTNPVNKDAYYCARLWGLTAGSHTIVVTKTTHAASNTYLDNFIIEAQDPPIVILFKGHRLLSWDIATSGYDYGHIRPTLQAQANPGATSIAVNQSPFSGSRQLLAATVPKAGEILVIDVGASQEVRTVTSVTGTGPFTINFSGGALVGTHVVGSRCELGIKDYDVRSILNPNWLEPVRAEFDDYVTMHDMDTYIQKNPKWFHLDFAHLNDEGQAMAAEQIYRQLVEERLIDPRGSSRLSRPVQVPSMRTSFLDASSPVAWIAMPSGLSEFPLTTTGNGGFRRVADLTRYYEARIGCIQTVLGATNAKLRIQYSIDAGTSWRFLHRCCSVTDPQATSTNWLEPTSATDPMLGQIDLNAAFPASGVKFSLWSPIYAEVLQQQYTDTLLRVTGIGGDSAARPAVTAVWLEFR
jgi:hypothetical protein